MLRKSALACALVGATLLALTASAHAATYYVAKNGNNSSGTGSSGSPWLTINHGVGQLSAGDTLIVRAGTYNEVVTINTAGTSGSPVVVRADSGATVVITGNNTLPATKWDSLVNIGGSYITFRGFEVRDSRGEGVRALSASNITIRDCTIHGNFSYSILFEMVTTGTIGNNTIYDNVRENASLISLGSSNVFVLQSTSVLVVDNTIRQNFGAGLTFREGSGNTARQNTLYDNVNQNLSMSDTTNIRLERNFVYCTLASAYSEGGTPPSGVVMIDVKASASGQNVIINNIFVGCEIGLDYTVGSGGDGLKKMTIANNTIVNMQDTALFIDSGGSHSASIFANNIVMRTSGSSGATNISGVSGITFANNNWFGFSPQSAAVGSGDVTSSCQLGNVAAFNANNFRISASSPCRDAGRSVALVTVDYFGTSRPQGSSPDIGAHEATGASTPDAAVTPDQAVGTPDQGVSPDTTAPTPDTGTTTPDTGTTTPDTGITTPDSGTTSPDSGTTTPDSATTSPDSGTTSPDSGTTSPDSGTTTGDSGTTTGDSGSTTGDSGSTTGDSGGTKADGGGTSGDGGGTSGDGGKKDDDDGGCSCTTSSSRPTGASVALMLFALVLFGRRRRRGRR